MKRLLVLLLILLGAPAFSQDGPPPIVEAFSPDSVESSSSYQCQGSMFKISFVVKSEIVSIGKYQSKGKYLSNTQLGRWNNWLSPLKSVDDIQFLCGSNVSSIAFTGPSRVDGQNTVQVYIEGGIVRPMRRIVKN
jgi:hypothetical protein